MKHSILKFNTLLFLFLLIVFSFVACNKDQYEDDQIQLSDNSDTNQQFGNQEPFVNNEILISFESNTNENEKQSIISSVNGKIKEIILTKSMERYTTPAIYVVEVASNSVLQNLQNLKGKSSILYAEPNYIYRSDAVSNDTYFTNGLMWGMYGNSTTPSNQYGSQAAESWTNNRTGSSSVFIGIIDEGIQYNHEDLIDNMWVNPYDPVDGYDNDGNGYVDDSRGWDFSQNNRTIYDGTQDNHGTHVAGTIGAKGGNGKGVAGICWNVKMISCKFLGTNGGTVSNAIKAVDYITDLKTRHGLNIPATNNSWGGGAYSQSLKNAIDRANVANIMFVVAAGNSSSNNDVTMAYPANYPSPNVISVASITSSGALSSFSNYGASKVHIAAPGSGIYSTLPNATNNAYGSYSGTSMATPHVTGAIALYAATHPYQSVSTTKAVIMSSVIVTPSLTGKCISNGRLDLSNF